MADILKLSIHQTLTSTKQNVTEWYLYIKNEGMSDKS